MPSRPVAGHCLCGCGPTLFLGSDGRIRCAQIDCPRPTAVDDLLAEAETEHVVELGETSFLVRHPLRERLDDALMTCELHARIVAAGRPPYAPGRYRISMDGGDWLWRPVPREGAAVHA